MFILRSAVIYDNFFEGCMQKNKCKIGGFVGENRGSTKDCYSVTAVVKINLEINKMLHFDSDYMEGMHPKILQRLVETNEEQTATYGFDIYSDSAKEKIKQACDCPGAEVFFLIGGTQTNATVIDAVLKKYEGVVSADTGHINVHEAGAVEFTGHKVLPVKGHNGKMDGQELENYLAAFHADGDKDHMVYPGMVYISHPTEYGTLYSASELIHISDVCKQYHIPLFLDGARLGYGLASSQTDVTLELIAKCCDVFYIGGIKVGAMFGEAVVVTTKGLVPHFFTIIKQHGALLAKGRMLGIQFDTLFTDNLYFEIAKNADRLAMKLKEAFLKKGYKLYMDSYTNQQFVILNKKQMEKLSDKVTFSKWEVLSDEETVVRFATSFMTKESDVDALIALL